MNKILKDAFVLLAITLVAGLLLGIVYSVTLDPINTQNQKKKEEACKEVFQDADSFESYDFDSDAMTSLMAEEGLDKVTVDEIYTAKDASGSELGYVITVTDGEGYGGDIQFSMGIASDGTINGISILSISETAGLGMKANTDEFKSQFVNKKVEKFTVTKTGATSDDEIDALSGATITTNAVTNGANGAILAFNNLEGGSN